MKNLFAIAIITFSLIGCGTSVEDEIEIRASNGNIEIQSVTDMVVIKKIIVNRGNCQIIVGRGATRKVYIPENLVLRYGKITTISTLCNNDEIREVEITTENGSTTVGFD
jgi:hypothetical protein